MIMNDYDLIIQAFCNAKREFWLKFRWDVNMIWDIWVMFKVRLHYNKAKRDYK